MALALPPTSLSVLICNKACERDVKPKKRKKEKGESIVEVDEKPRKVEERFFELNRTVK